MTYANYCQTITFRSSEDLERLLALAVEWDVQQATSDIMGYMGMRVLADREEPGRFVIIAEFGVVDPDVPAAEEAQRNNERPETQRQAAKLVALVERGEIDYRDYNELYRTDR